MTPTLPRTEWIWRDGAFVRWEDATLHVMAHVVHYGSAVFEGIRCYATPAGPAVFRLDAHVRRLHDSARIMRMEPAFDRPTLAAACRAVVRRNRLEACYLRPIVLRGAGAAGIHPAASPIHVFIVCWPWGDYLGDGALDRGVDVGVASWQRPAPNTLPALAKLGGAYANAQLIKMEAVANGYDEAVALSRDGLVSEASGQNLFLVRDGTLWTPAVDGSLLSGITRDCVLVLAREAGLPVREQAIPRELLYCADEVFLTGTASELTPVRSVDRIPVGEGGVGPVTRCLQRRLLAIARGEEPDPFGWCAPVHDPAAAREPRPARAAAVAP